MIDPIQFRDEVVEPTLRAMGMWSVAAERLILGTALAESQLTWLRQHGGGPALGVMQVEPATAHDLLRRYLSEKRTDLNLKLCNAVFLPGAPATDWRQVSDPSIARQLTGNLRFAVALARIRYWMAPAPLPGGQDATDPLALGRYWKRHYNTPLGAGEPDKFADALERVYPRRR